jgi:broad specificity phosphatase PhoE
MTRLILIRHGETNWNVEQRKQGRNDQPLNEKGARQAKLAAEYVKANYEIGKVWSSPLQRCSNTAALFNMPIETSDHLLEIDYGDWEGMLTSDIESSLLRAKEPQAPVSGRVDGDARPSRPTTPGANVDAMDAPGGEKRSDLPVRANAWIAESGIAEQGGDVVLVGHGGSMKGLITGVLGLPDSAMDILTIDNCSVTVLDITPDPKTPNKLITLNQTSHLT